MEKELGDLFRQIYRRHRMLVQEYLSQHGLYLGQPRILFTLQDNPETTLTDLASRLNITKESLSVSIKRLSNAGLICRDVDKDDKRRYVLSLSENGETVANACKEGFDDINERLFDNLSDEEKATQRALFIKMIETMEERGNT